MTFGLTADSIEAIRCVLGRHPAVSEALVFGSRALGRQHPRSDIDVALCGDLPPLEAERIALELDDLPLPLHFDVQALNSIRHRELREHIARVGKSLYRRKDDCPV